VGDQRLPERHSRAPGPGRCIHPEAPRKASRLAPENSVQAIVMSQAGLPTPEMFGFTRT
jgi:hypothetical protein